MSHDEFVAAYRAGKIRVQIDRARASRMVARRTLLPLVLLPAFGIAVAIALIGHFIVGAALFVALIGLRFLVRRSSPGFVLRQALADARFYEEAVSLGALRVEPL